MVEAPECNEMDEISKRESQRTLQGKLNKQNSTEGQDGLQAEAVQNITSETTVIQFKSSNVDTGEIQTEETPLAKVHRENDNELIHPLQTDIPPTNVQGREDGTGSRKTDSDESTENTNRDHSDYSGSKMGDNDDRKKRNTEDNAYCRTSRKSKNANSNEKGDGDSIQFNESMEGSDDSSVERTTSDKYSHNNRKENTYEFRERSKADIDQKAKDGTHELLTSVRFTSNSIPGHILKKARLEMLDS
ncbi:hypothetical protein DPMN_053080 [Dreissena polymorpha]|uniref:Uncharacterized protein n=1 Tax=Dreissena polymorpha TaxID=45954 RepID=A0A9D4CM22_DREPO|nr:hypothetical protein DPMN_053080 [Dreissena polymorpha]